MTRELTHARALWLLALCALLWSMGGLLIKSVDLHPCAIAGVRSGIVCLVVLAVFRKLNFIWTRAQWGSALTFVGTVLLFVSATKLTTAANAILLQYTAPVWVAAFSWYFLKERITRLDWLTTALVLGGMVLFFVEEIAPAHFMGNMLAIASGVSFAWLALFLRKQNGVSLIESVFLGNLLTAVIGVPFLLVGPMPSPTEIGLLSVLGVFQLGIPYILYGIAMRKASALEGILIPIIEPLLNPVWVALFYGEKPSLFALIGGAIVIGAIISRSLIQRRLASTAVSQGSTAA